MKIIRRLLHYSRPLHHYLPEYILYTMLGIVLGIVNFTMLIPLLNLLFNSDTLEACSNPPSYEFSVNYLGALFEHHLCRLAIEKGMLAALAAVCAVITVATVFSNLFRYLATRVLVRLKLNLLQRLRNHLFKQVTEQSLAWHHKHEKGDVLSTMTNDVQEIEFSVISSFQILLRDPAVIVAYFITLFILSPQLTFFTVLFFPVAGLLISTLSKKLKKKGYFSQEMLGKILQHTDQTLSGIRIIQAFRSKKLFIKQFEEINSGFTKNSKALFNQRELASPLSDILGVCVIVVVVLYGGSLVVDNTLSGSMFITYLAIYSQILQPAKNISSALTNMQKGMVSAERIFSIIDAKIEIQDANNALEIKDFDRQITFKNVSFNYGNEPVLQSVSFELQKGRTLALVGKSGSGKSTIADLIMRFYTCTDGEILLDGKNINTLSIDSVRSVIALVNQDPIIFNDTVLGNITMGAESVNMLQVEAAARHAHAEEFINQLENGYQTVLGDRGSRLSGGQRQRIAIARALYSNAPILILDEATSALDTESEQNVQEAISELMKERTVLVIAHRLSTIRRADEILVLSEGKVAERGTHAELMQQQGVYRKLQEMQEIA
jgi:subfamily B ATP-binding cassette protein MsbA